MTPERHPSRRPPGKAARFQTCRCDNGVTVLTRSLIRKLFIAIAGFTVLLIGIAMIVLPGPALIVIPLGLAILATEFVWARSLLQKTKEAVARKTSNRQNVAVSTPPSE